MDDHSDPAELTALRALLLDPEQRRLDEIQRRLDDPEARAADIGDVLPQVLLQHAQDPHFTRALAPPLEKAFTASVRRDPKPMADALFPIMGPAIRKAVAAGLAGMVDSLNRTLEHSLSWKSLQWRIEARRTGRSFGEVLLLNTLVYRVEQVFLIDRRSGILLQHVHHGAEGMQDADMVSGMLTAIQDFVRDSFKVAEGDSLEALKVGELSVWVEPGPLAIVAAVTRGAVPREYRRTLQDAVESIHLQFAEPLEHFSGDTSTLDDARPTLEGCVETQYRADERKPRTRGAKILAAVVLSGLVVWAGVAYRAHQRWTRYVSALSAEPGLVVVSTSRAGGKYVVSGLRDPMSRDPKALLPAAGLSEDVVEGRWAPYYSLDAPLMLSRAAAVLSPPAGVTLALQDGVPWSEGDAPPSWVAEAARLGPLVPGVVRFDAIRALDGSIRETIAAIESTPVLFAKGSAQPMADQRVPLDRIVTSVRRLETTAVAAHTRFRLDIVGHTDMEGPPISNVPLSQARAATVRAAIDAERVPHVTIVTSGVGSTDPATGGQSDADNQRNRRVAIRVTRIAAE